MSDTTPAPEYRAPSVHSIAQRITSETMSAKPSTYRTGHYNRMQVADMLRQVGRRAFLEGVEAGKAIAARDAGTRNEQ